MNLLDKSSETLASRIQTFNLPPACFGENHGPPLVFSKWQADLGLGIAASRELDSFLEYGGFPEVLVSAKTDKKELLSIYKNSYFTRDIAFFMPMTNKLIDGCGFEAGEYPASPDHS